MARLVPLRPRALLGAGAALALLLLAAGAAEARTRTFCKTWYYGGKSVNCGRHLQPACTSGSACDSGYSSYSGDPFPITIDCPSPISNESVSAGCYDSSRIPDCGACSGPGQVPCPAAASNFCNVGCDAGLEPNPTTTLCEAPGTPGTPCGPGYGCGPGLTCDPLSLTCKGDAKAGESCASPWVSCASGLSCTLALECSHDPARLGETCDVFNPCGSGLYCKPGIPQRCHERAKPGEACGPGRPCMNGFSCEVCLVSGCNAPLQCFPDGTQGAISAQQCKTLHSPALHRGAMNQGLAQTYGGGDEIAGLVGESQEFGVAYGADGRYGCYTSLCGGLNADVSIEFFGSVGFYETFDDVGGSSFVNFQEAQLPGNLLNFSTSQIFSRLPHEIIPQNPRLIGTADAFSIGLGPNILPFSAGSFVCETVLDVILPGSPTSGGGSPPPAAPAPPPPSGGIGALALDGVDDALAVTDAAALAALRMTGPFTVETWIRPAAPAQNLAFLNKEGEYEVGLLGGELAWAIAYPGGWVWIRTGAFPSVGSWSHVAVAYDGSAVRTYLNGEPIHWKEASGAVGDVHTAENQLQIGSRQRGADAFAGDVDAVRIWSRALSRAEIRAGLDDTPASSAPGLVASWEFEESGGSLLEDAGPNGFDLALDALGAARAPQRTAEDRARSGGALLFDGVDDHVAVTEPDALDGLEMLDALTVEAWIFPTGPGSGPSGGAIVNKEGEYALGRATDGRINFALANTSPGWVTVTTNAVAPVDTWTHVALVYAAGAGEARVYLNGALAETRAASGVLGDFHPDLVQLRIGGRERDDTAGANQRFQGVIDEVRIWGLARSASEIAAHFDGPVSPDSLGLFGWWRFDEGPTGAVFDTSPLRHHGVLGSGRPVESPRRTEAAAFFGYPVAAAAPARDADGDGVGDGLDNCTDVANPSQPDADADGFGNACDCDFDQDGGCGIADFNVFLVDFGAGTDGGTGTDMDGDGAVGIGDFNLFLTGFGRGTPGPSAFGP